MAGWLAITFDVPTPTSALVQYRPGKPLRQFQGERKAIIDWTFVAEGKQIALKDLVPEGRGPHCELRDTETGDLLETWDGDLTPSPPDWARGLKLK